MGRKSLITLIVIAAVLIVGGVIFAASNNSNDNTSTTPTTDTSMKGMDMNSNASQTPSTSGPSTSSSVAIQDFAFSPASITVKKGTTVTWTNKDSTTHTVTSTSGPSSFDSGDLATGKSFSHTFDTAGTYNYKCSIHPNMTGTVTVTE